MLTTIGAPFDCAPFHSLSKTTAGIQVKQLAPTAGCYCDGERPMNLSAHWMNHFMFGASVWPPSS
jgi:hypothetical protein